jgi:hypothetical protein
MGDNPTPYHPAAALVLFKPDNNEGGIYIEHYDMDSEGCPVNRRPLPLVRQARLPRHWIRIAQKRSFVQKASCRSTYSTSILARAAG